MLDRYVRHIQGGGMATGFDLVTLKDHLANSVVDAQGSAGHLAPSNAMDRAIGVQGHFYAIGFGHGNDLLDKNGSSPKFGSRRKCRILKQVLFATLQN